MQGVYLADRLQFDQLGAVCRQFLLTVALSGCQPGIYNNCIVIQEKIDSFQVHRY